MNRRKVLGMSIAGALGGKKMVASAVDEFVQSSPASPRPLSWLPISDYGEKPSENKWEAPLGPFHTNNTPEGWVKILGNRLARDRIESELYRCYYYVNGIDPDIDVLRSFSKMAKITFQRQRMVERALKKRLGEEQDIYSQFGEDNIYHLAANLMGWKRGA